MTISILDLLRRVDPAIESLVKQTRDRNRPILQEALRTECRLAMRTASDSDNNRKQAQVPIDLVPGFPVSLGKLAFNDDLGPIFLLSRYRSALEQSVTGTAGLIRLKTELEIEKAPANWSKVESNEINNVHNWAVSLLSQLNKQDPLKIIFDVSEDILGTYNYQIDEYQENDEVPNNARIEIYWGIIGLVSDWLGCQVEDLTTVVLSHEMAHAYTQLGADIEGRRWLAKDYRRAEHGLIEGLAQYYTHRVLQKLNSRFPHAFQVYERLLKHQPMEYSAHRKWCSDYSPESVRRAMIEVRRWQEHTLEQFTARLQSAEESLNA